MLAIRRTSTIVATRHLRSIFTETSKPWIDPAFSTPRHTSSTAAAATRHPYLRSISTETSKSWIDPAFSTPRPTSSTATEATRHTNDDPPKGKGYPRMSFPDSSKLEIPMYRLHCKSSRNNTIITFTDNAGQVIAWQSGGKCEFKGANRASYEAGYQCAVRIFRVIENLAYRKGFNVALYLKGFGQGREAFKTALLAVEGQNIRSLISSVTDRTPIKIGGTRAPKMRRL
jgi:small subunit ribosomal protein S11